MRGRDTVLGTHTIVWSAPPCRKDTRRSPGRSRLAAGVVAVVLVLSPVADSAQVAATASHAVLEQLPVLLDPDQGR